MLPMTKQEGPHTPRAFKETVPSNKTRLCRSGRRGISSTLGYNLNTGLEVLPADSKGVARFGDS